MGNQKSLVQRLERMLEDGVGDVFARVFGGSIVPQEVEALLRREASDAVQNLPGDRYLAPNDYVITLSDSDYRKFSADREFTSGAFARHLGGYIQEQGWQTYGDVVVRFEQSDHLHTGQYRARAVVNPDADPNPSHPAPVQGQPTHAYTAEPGAASMTDNSSYRGGHGTGEDHHEDPYGQSQDAGAQDQQRPAHPADQGYAPSYEAPTYEPQGYQPRPAYPDQGGYPDHGYSQGAGQGSGPGYGQGAAPGYGQGYGYEQRPAPGYSPGYDQGYRQAPPPGYGGQPSYGPPPGGGYQAPAGDYDYGRPRYEEQGYGRQDPRQPYPEQQGYPQQQGYNYGRAEYAQPEYGQEYAQPEYGQPGGYAPAGPPAGYGQPPAAGDYDYGQPAGHQAPAGYGQPGGYAPPAAPGEYAAAARSVTLQLDDGSGRTYQLREGANVIGRGQEAQFRLPDTGVSRRHLEIRWDGQVALLSDLNSTNGTTVNNAPVQEWQLADGDVIRLGHSEIIVHVR